jgi:hypothetical protein
MLEMGRLTGTWASLICESVQIAVVFICDLDFPEIVDE